MVSKFSFYLSLYPSPGGGGDSLSSFTGNYTYLLPVSEGLRDITVPETVDVVFEENNGKLVLVTGQLDIEDALEDPAYAISINAVKLRRVVQVYQWYETEDQTNMETGEHDSHREKTYSYNRDWFEYHIDSESFYNTLGKICG